MPPSVALYVFVLGIAGLIYLDRDADEQTSPALWIPIAWMAIGASRMISTWFVMPGAADADQYLEGSPVDALLLAALEAAALAVLAARNRKTRDLLRGNLPILVFFLYCLSSTMWSDFPLIAFKRWIKGIGNVAMVFVALTDPKPSLAVRRLVTWTGFILIPLSIVVIKYYPELGRNYDKWTGEVNYAGVAEGKNSLGAQCFIFGLAAFWNCIQVFREKPRQNRRLLAYGVLLAMDAWLFYRVDSSTAIACFALGAGLIVMTTMIGMGRPWVTHVLFGTIASAVLIGFLNASAFATVTSSLGRDTSLTGRTDLWQDILNMPTHPLIGAGFESFFLGDRLDVLWRKYWWHPNEAHNGYIEVYLNLGYVGIALLGVVFFSGYRNVVAAFRERSSLATLRLALLVVTIPYNLTETAFKVMHPMLICFLLSSAAMTQLAPEAIAEGTPSPKAPMRPEPQPGFVWAHAKRRQLTTAKQ